MQGECERARQWTSVELDGELSEFERVLLQGHLAGCASCREFRTAAFRVTGELRAAPLEPFRVVDHVGRIGRRLPLRLAPTVAAMAIVAVGLGSILASSEIRPGTAVSAPPQTPSASLESSLVSGPVSQRVLNALRREAAEAVPTVDTGKLQRSLRGGVVLK